MTRIEAIIAFKGIENPHSATAEAWIDRFVALGILKLDPTTAPPLTPLEKLEHQLRLKYFSDNNVSDLKMALGVAGLEVVEKTKR